MTALDRVLAEVGAERARQDDRWGQQDHDAPMWLAILTEEVGEVAKEIAEGRINPFAALNYRTELVQVAAVAVSAVQALDRKASCEALDRLGANRERVNGSWLCPVCRHMPDTPVCALGCRA